LYQTLFYLFIFPQLWQIRNGSYAIIFAMRQLYRICFFSLLALVLTSCAGNTNPTANSPQGTTSPKNSPASITNVGSDTMVNLALAWAEVYHTVRPEISVSVTGGGSGTGIAALVNGTVDIANASRVIKSEELDNAAKQDLHPMEYVVAKDAIAVVVHPSNPINQLTLEQISAIYSGQIDPSWAGMTGRLYACPVRLTQAPMCISSRLSYAWVRQMTRLCSQRTHC
jgi:hypothetical protein